MSAGFPVFTSNNQELGFGGVFLSQIKFYTRKYATKMGQ